MHELSASSESRRVARPPRVRHTHACHAAARARPGPSPGGDGLCGARRGLPTGTGRRALRRERVRGPGETARRRARTSPRARQTAAAQNARSRPPRRHGTRLLLRRRECRTPAGAHAAGRGAPRARSRCPRVRRQRPVRAGQMRRRRPATSQTGGAQGRAQVGAGRLDAAGDGSGGRTIVACRLRRRWNEHLRRALPVSSRCLPLSVWACCMRLAWGWWCAAVRPRTGACVRMGYLD